MHALRHLTCLGLQPSQQVRVNRSVIWTLAQVCPLQKGAQPLPPYCCIFISWGRAHKAVFSWLSAVFVAALTILEVGTISHQQSITDTLWRAVDFHRSGRRGLSQKTAFIRRGFAEGKFSNYYPYILDHSIFDGQRATLRPGVIGVQEEAWEISSESAEEAEENPESQEPVSVAAKAAWGSASGPKEPPFPPPSSPHVSISPWLFQPKVGPWHLFPVARSLDALLRL